jgi:hypothetical protein
MTTFATVAIAWVAAIAVVLALLTAAHRLSNTEDEAQDPAEEAEAGDNPGVP